MEHTKGPWKIATYTKHTGWAIHAGEAGCIAERWYSLERTPEENLEMMANALLMAAAPELIAALKELMPEGWGEDNTMDHMPGVKLARLAIAKAEGR